MTGSIPRLIKAVKYLLMVAAIITVPILGNYGASSAYAEEEETKRIFDEVLNFDCPCTWEGWCYDCPVPMVCNDCKETEEGSTGCIIGC